MNQKIIGLFAICMSVRIGLALFAKQMNVGLLKYAGYIALLLPIGTTYIFLTNARKSGIGAFGEKIWWANLRPIHALLYLAFAYYAIIGNKNAWLFLLADALFGLTCFLIVANRNGL